MLVYDDKVYLGKYRYTTGLHELLEYTGATVTEALLETLVAFQGPASQTADGEPRGGVLYSKQIEEVSEGTYSALQAMDALQQAIDGWRMVNGVKVAFQALQDARNAAKGRLGLPAKALAILQADPDFSEEELDAIRVAAKGNAATEAIADAEKNWERALRASVVARVKSKVDDETYKGYILENLLVVGDAATGRLKAASVPIPGVRGAGRSSGGGRTSNRPTPTSIEVIQDEEVVTFRWEPGGTWHDMAVKLQASGVIGAKSTPFVYAGFRTMVKSSQLKSATFRFADFPDATGGYIAKNYDKYVIQSES